MKQECAKYPNAEIVWAQEEHKNQGSWTYVQPRFQTALTNSRDVRYENDDHFRFKLTTNLIYKSSFVLNLAMLDVRQRHQQLPVRKHSITKNWLCYWKLHSVCKSNKTKNDCETATHVTPTYTFSLRMYRKWDFSNCCYSMKSKSKESEEATNVRNKKQELYMKNQVILFKLQFLASLHPLTLLLLLLY